MGTGRQLAAILFTDIVGYTALMQKNEQSALQQMKHYSTTLEESVTRHEGRVLNDYGDGSLCIFPHTNAALNCALELQARFRTHPQIPLRIGVHVSEVFFEGSKAMGDGVNIASRIQSLGQANTILISKEVFDKIKNHPEFSTISLGTYHFKNVEEPLQVFALTNEGLTIPDKQTLEGKLENKELGRLRLRNKKLLGAIVLFLLLVIGGYFASRYTSKLKAAPQKTNAIAVLYFNNMSGDASQEYFSDGITEEIISRLSRITGLKVKSRTSVLQYKQGAKNTKQIARELGVNIILEGSIRKQGNTVRITAQLINAAKDEHIWSEDYDRELKDVFAVQTEIAQAIAQKFRMPLSEANKKELRTNPTDNMEAYDQYLKASSLAFIYGGLGGQHENTQKIILHLRQAIQLDPKFTDAYALLSEYFSIYSLDAVQPALWLDSAQILAQRAIALNPNHEKGYIAMGLAKETQGQYNEAIKWYLKAHEIVPFSTAGKIAYIYLLLNDHARCLEWVKKAKEYDVTEIANYLLTEGLLYLNLGLLDSLKSSFYQARKIKPDAPEVDNMASEYYLHTGNKEEYIRLNRRIITQDDKELAYRIGVFHLFQRDWVPADSLFAISSKPDDMDAGLIQLQLGNRAAGKRYLEKAINRRIHFSDFEDRWHLLDISRCYAALQDDRYITYFKQALAKGWHLYTFFINDPFFDAVRGTPEFKELEQMMQARNERFKRNMYAAAKT